MSSTTWWGFKATSNVTARLQAPTSVTSKQVDLGSHLVDAGLDQHLESFRYLGISKTLMSIATMAPITINCNTIDLDPVALPGYFSSDASQSNYIIIQLAADRLSQEQLTILRAMKINVQEFLGYGHYLCRYAPSDLDTVKKLPWIKQAIIYHSDFKIHPKLLQNTRPNEANSAKLPDTGDVPGAANVPDGLDILSSKLTHKLIYLS